MHKEDKNTDYLALIILAAFLILSTSHFICCFDVKNAMECIFEKTWANQTTSPVNLQSTVGISSGDTLIPAAKSQTIVRNPFVPPVTFFKPDTAVKPSTRNCDTFSYVSQPFLRGIINNGVQQLAIIEFNNTSNYYKNGQSFGDYTIVSISADSVDLRHQQNSLHLSLGRNN